MSDDKVRMTGLWRHESKDGKVYLTGKVSPSSKLLILENDYKNKDNDPDYVAYLTSNNKESNKGKEDKKDNRGL